MLMRVLPTQVQVATTRELDPDPSADAAAITPLENPEPSA
jgi:hypothetical protein